MLFVFDFSPLFSFAIFGHFVISVVCFPFSSSTESEKRQE